MLQKLSALSGMALSEFLWNLFKIRIKIGKLPLNESKKNVLLLRKPRGIHTN